MSIKQSIFEEIVIESNDGSRQVDITSGVIQINYYEDVFSPTITAKMRIVNTGNTIASPNGSDPVKQSIYHGLPLRGGERVSLKVAGNSDRNPGLDFSTNPKTYLYVSSISDVIVENNKESFTLNLVSREAITNETTRVTNKYITPINESVSSILSNILKVNKIGTIDKTKNKYNFIGNLRKPFTVLTWLASKAVPDVPGDGTAGFFFYQTVDGFQFRSIDLLNDEDTRKDIKGDPIVLVYSEATENYNQDNQKVNNDLKILNYNIERNQNLIEKLRLGTYSNYRIFFDPLTGSITEPGKIKFKQSDYASKTKNLGKEEIKLPSLTQGSSETLGDTPTRIMTGILDVGTMDSGVSTKVNANQIDYQSQSLLRYNFLFTQSLNVMIPSNTNLRAGDSVRCVFPKVSTNPAREYDYDASGLYMIKELCHHFDARNSYTSLKLVRDTFGYK